MWIFMQNFGTVADVFPDYKAVTTIRPPSRLLFRWREEDAMCAAAEI
jgi:hypothetical protein